jgi:hypothetical protein
MILVIVVVAFPLADGCSSFTWPWPASIDLPRHTFLPLPLRPLRGILDNKRILFYDSTLRALRPPAEPPLRL